MRECAGFPASDVRFENGSAEADWAALQVAWNAEQAGEDFLNAGDTPLAHEHCQGTHKTSASRDHCESLPARVARAEARREFRQILKSSSVGRPEPITEGFYVKNGVVFKVVRAIHGSGNLYAKELVIDELSALEVAPELRGSGQKFSHGTWIYARGAINHLRIEHKLTAEKAVALGKLYGMCVRCGATLTREESIERGMGPVCAGKGF